jgi:hypothetical protein
MLCRDYVNARRNIKGKILFSQWDRLSMGTQAQILGGKIPFRGGTEPWPARIGAKPSKHDSPASGDCLVPENVASSLTQPRQSTATNNLIVQPHTRKANSLITKERLIGGRLPWALCGFVL